MRIKMSIKRFSLTVLCCVYVAMGLGLPGSAQAKVPLLMEGKRTLYQRVLTRPGAKLYPAAGHKASGRELPAFSVFYVYGRRTSKGVRWLEVGANSRGNIEGRLRADQTIDWKQTMVVAFTNPAGRSRLPLFQGKRSMVRMLEADDAVKANNRLVAQLSRGRAPANSPAISIEPATYVDFTQHFYLLPILEADEVYFANGFSARVLKVASVTAENTVSNRPRPARSVAGQGSARQFKTAIAFVIDATISMGDYIDRTRLAIENIYRRIDRAGLRDQVSFALVGYRDNTDVVPGLEYVSRVFADFQDSRSSQYFLQRAGAVKPSTVSSQGFAEDAYAGVSEAITRLDWEGFGGRYIVLITDAGARDAGDPLGATGLNASLLRSEALDKGIAIATLHLLTPAGSQDHGRAAAQYRTLSDFRSGNLYYGVRAGDVEEMGRAIERMADQLITQIRRVAEDRDSAQDWTLDLSPTQGASRTNGWETELAKVGYAMRLAYLGRIQGTRAPSVFEAWIADRDVGHPESPALEVRVLLTKNQLSDLQEVLRIIIAAGERGELSPKDFFEEIKTAAAIFSRDPTQAGRRSFKNLAESGLLGEYLDGLPYRSKVMSVTQELWESWSIGEQQAFLDELDAKVKLYKKYHDDVDRWILLSATASPGEAVYPVPLDALP